MRRSRLQPVHGYCAAVSILGLTVLAELLVGDGVRLSAVLSWKFVFFAIFVIFG
jgi:hypothetical protein